MLRAFLVLVCLAASPALAQTMMHHHAMMDSGDGAPITPTQGGQSAFAAIQEIVAILDADPKTDWSKVDIEALRQHLIDMDAVTLRAEVEERAGRRRHAFRRHRRRAGADSIRRMVFAHAATMNGVGGWTHERGRDRRRRDADGDRPGQGRRQADARSASSAC